MDILLQAGYQLVSFGFVPPAINNSSPGTREEGKNGIWQKNCNEDKDAMETSSKGCRSQGGDKLPIYPDLPLGHPSPFPKSTERARQESIAQHSHRDDEESSRRTGQ